VLDVAKPWPIGWLDARVRGGLGVMLDDAVAGLLGGAAILAGRAATGT
jgi:phosphatidylglycerophosphatase A